MSVELFRLDKDESALIQYFRIITPVAQQVFLQILEEQAKRSTSSSDNVVIFSRAATK